MSKIEKVAEEQAELQITPQIADLIERIVATAVTEAKRPYVTDEELKAQENARKDRKELAEMKLREMQNRRARQKRCQHMRRDNTCRAVFVENGGFMICQACQAIIRPGIEPEGYKGTDIFDTQLFDRLFQLSQPVAMG